MSETNKKQVCSKSLCTDGDKKQQEATKTIKKTEKKKKISEHRQF